MSTFLHDENAIEINPVRRAKAAKALQEGELIKAAEIFIELKDYQRAARAFENAGENDKALIYFKMGTNEIDKVRQAEFAKALEEEAYFHASNGDLKKARVVCKKANKMDIFEALVLKFGNVECLLSWGARKEKYHKIVKSIKDRELCTVEKLNRLGMYFQKKRNFKKSFICYMAADNWSNAGKTGTSLKRFKDAGCFFEKAGLFREASLSFKRAGMLKESFINLARANPSSYPILKRLKDLANEVNDEDLIRNELDWCFRNECYNSMKTLGEVLDKPEFMVICSLREKKTFSHAYNKFESVDELEFVAQWAWHNNQQGLFCKAFLKNHTICFPCWRKGIFTKENLPFFFKCFELYLLNEANQKELDLFLLMVQKRDVKGILACWIMDILDKRGLYSKLVNMLEHSMSSSSFDLIHDVAKLQLSQKPYYGSALIWRCVISKCSDSLLRLLNDLEKNELSVFVASHLNCFELLTNFVYQDGYDNDLATFLKVKSPNLLGKKAEWHKDYRTAGEAYLSAQDFEKALLNAQLAEDSYTELGALLAMRKKTLIYQFLEKPKGINEARKWLSRKPSNELEKRTRRSLRRYVKNAGHI